MNEPGRNRLLAIDEPPSVTVYRADARGLFVLICDHVSQRIPRALGNLGLPAAELDRHIAWDIGAASVATRLAAELDAVLLLQNYSRLVIDCNRPLDAPDSIPTWSDGTEIPGNRDLEDTARRQRVAEIFAPYHARIVAELDARARPPGARRSSSRYTASRRFCRAGQGRGTSACSTEETRGSPAA